MRTINMDESVIDHLAREFEKVHDAFPKLETRIAVIEAWQSHHPETHKLEGKALELAEKATAIKLELFDREHQRVVRQIGSLLESRDSSVGEKVEYGRFLPWLLAAATSAIAFFKK